ncbi:MAG: hypothetical protein MUF83_09055 [Acidimicrobiales bacterium]|nr:hypothetical protein [Acidimicrobiales bacterium]
MSPPSGTRLAARLAVALLAVLALASIPGCSDDGDEATTGTGATGQPTLPAPDGSALPPDDVDALGELYDPVLAAHGVVLTRGVLVDTSGGGYERSDEGTHLALYVRPVGPRTPDRYVEGIYELAALLSPDVFARWPGLQTYDICQEDADATEPLGAEVGALTQVELPRAVAEEFDWATGDLGDLVVLSRTTDGVRVFARAPVDEDPAWLAAQQAADDLVGSTTVPRITATTVGTAGTPDS